MLKGSPEQLYNHTVYLFPSVRELKRSSMNHAHGDSHNCVVFSHWIWISSVMYFLTNRVLWKWHCMTSRPWLEESQKPCSVHRGILERSLCEKPAVREAQQRHHHVVRKLALWRSSVGRGKLAWQWCQLSKSTWQHRCERATLDSQSKQVFIQLLLQQSAELKPQGENHVNEPRQPTASWDQKLFS